MATSKTPETRETPSERIKSAVAALEEAVKNQTDEIDNKLKALKEVLISIDPEGQKTLEVEIKLAELAVSSKKEIRKRVEGLGVLTAIADIRAKLDRLKGEVGAGYADTQTTEEEEKGVNPFLLSLGKGIKTGAGATWTGLKSAGNFLKVNGVYAWKNFIVKPFSVIMGYFGVKNIQMPPVALHARSLFLRFVGGFMPKATREAMQKKLDEEFAFHAITGESKLLIADLNEIRANKKPPEKPITLDFKGQLTQFRLLTAEERKGIPRKVMAAVKEGKTEITLETLFDGSKTEKTAGTEKTADGEKTGEKTPETKSVKASLDKSYSFVELCSEQEIAGYKIQIIPSPAAIIVDGKTWTMKGVSSEKQGINLSITQASWKGSQLSFSVEGSFPIFGVGMQVFANVAKNTAIGLLGISNSKQVMSREETKAFLKELSTSKGPYHVKDKEDKYIGIDLVS